MYDPPRRFTYSSTHILIYLTIKGMSMKTMEEVESKGFVAGFIENEEKQKWFPFFIICMVYTYMYANMYMKLDTGHEYLSTYI